MMDEPLEINTSFLTTERIELKLDPNFLSETKTNRLIVKNYEASNQNLKRYFVFSSEWSDTTNSSCVRKRSPPISVTVIYLNEFPLFPRRKGV